MNDDALPHPHNRFFLQTFSQIDRARGLIKTFLPEAVLSRLDLESMRVASGSYIDDALRQSQSDLLFEVDRVDAAEPSLVYLLASIGAIHLIERTLLASVKRVVREAANLAAGCSPGCSEDEQSIHKPNPSHPAELQSNRRDLPIASGATSVVGFCGCDSVKSSDAVNRWLVADRRGSLNCASQLIH